MVWIALLLAWTVGWAWVRWRMPATHWTGIALQAIVSLPAGIGLTSFLYFLLLWAGARNPLIFAGTDLALLGAGLWLGRGQSGSIREYATPGWILILASVAAFGLIASAVATSADRNPHGDWDAWAIWNLRAKYLAGPDDSWRTAVSPSLFRSHPDYPLLLSGSVARAWRTGGDMDPTVPKTLGFALFLAVPALLFGILAALRNSAAGCLAVLIMATSSGYLVLGPSQYADIPLSLFFAAAIGCALLESHELGGFFASCAAWTQNEGLVFAIAYLAFTRRRKALLAALPGLAVVLAFKLALAPPPEFAGHTLRWDGIGAVLTSFATEFHNLGSDVTHPLLLLAILAAGMKFALPVEQQWTACLATIGVQLASYIAALLARPDSLDWQLGNATGRLVAQIWPSLVLLAIARLRWTSSVLPTHP